MDRLRSRSQRADPRRYALLVIGILAITMALAWGWPVARWPVALIATSGTETTPWEALVPKEWDPLKRYRDMNLAAMSDSNPRVLALMREMRETWDNAPTNGDLDGSTVKLAGYVVPLESSSAGVSEFLLVPYFGACIHTPPPPANQIVHVKLVHPVPGLRTMAAVAAHGTLSTLRGDTLMGMSGYTMAADRVEAIKPSR